MTELILAFIAGYLFRSFVTPRHATLSKVGQDMMYFIFAPIILLMLAFVAAVLLGGGLVVDDRED